MEKNYWSFCNNPCYSLYLKSDSQSPAQEIRLLLILKVTQNEKTHSKAICVKGAIYCVDQQ